MQKQRFKKSMPVTASVFSLETSVCICECVNVFKPRTFTGLAVVISAVKFQMLLAHMYYF